MQLISMDEARSRVLGAVSPLPAEAVPLDACRGRILAEDVESEVDVPPFDSSAMDGFAVVAGPGRELEVVGESRAGHPVQGEVAAGTAIRISTGARVPPGADAVVPVERTEGGDGRVVVPRTDPGANVRRAGEDITAGAVVLRAGTRLGPAEVGVLASLGRAEAACAQRPKTALLVTGDELAEPGEALGPGRIWSSNAFALAAQLAEAGAEIAQRENVPDEPAPTRAALERALRSADLVCVSGGVSVGPHDHVKEALAELGVAERFWGIALKPGKPTWFGSLDHGERRVLVFGLPGNPVSAMVTFQLLARPALAALQGAPADARRATARLDEPVARNPRRDQAVRCRLRAGPDGWRAAPTGEQGSHQLTSMLGADALALVPRGDGELGRDEPVEVELLDFGGAP